MPDVLVIGSGAAGAHVAWALVHGGRSVRMLDYGNVDATYADLIPPLTWAEIRETDEQQHRYFLGDRFEGVGFGRVRVGAQLTPPRNFISEDTERLLPVDSQTFSVTESLARGGLASGWGAGIFPFDDRDLRGTPLTRADLQPHYEAISERIGVAGARDDDLLPFLGDSPSLLPPLDVDSGAERVMRRYTARRELLRRKGFHLGVTRLAVCSEKHHGRGPHQYRDMEFWADTDRSVYRPRWTLEELDKHPRFERCSRRLALTYQEDAQGVVVRARHADTGEIEEHRASALVLAAGALGSARIALRSSGQYDVPIPILCNPYTYVPVLNTGMLGVSARDRRHSLAQLTAILETDGGNGPIVQAQYYSYRSLLLFKLQKESPLGCRTTLDLLRRLTPAMGILGIHHEDRTSPTKRCVLRKGSGDEPDRLEIDYLPDAAVERRQSSEEHRMLSFFRRLGCWSLRRIRPGHGSNIHYAGTLPMSSEDAELTCDADCRLRGTRSVYVADGAVFPYLPAKGLTATIMANADRVGTILARRMS